MTGGNTRARKIRALIFDFDGLILDTESPEYVTWCEIYEEHGCVLPVEEWAKLVGGGANEHFDPFAYLEQLYGKSVDRAAIAAQRLRRDEQRIASQPVLPGVEDCLNQAKRLRLKLAVASSSPLAWVEGHLTRLGLLHYFDAIRTRDDVANIKPDPELFIAACEALGVEPHEAMVFEDSPNGVLAARRAGIFVVAVPNPLTARMVIDRPDVLLTSLADVPLEALIRRVEYPNGAGA